MSIRNETLDVLNDIQERNQSLIKIVDGMTDEELDNILDGYLSEYGTNIDVNFSFMQMILTRQDWFDYQDPECDYKMSNKELEKYLNDRWDLLIGP